MSSKAADPLASQGAYPPATRSRWSLGARLTLWYALSAFGLVLAAVSILYWGLVKGLEAEDDQALEERISGCPGLAPQYEGGRLPVEMGGSVGVGKRRASAILYPRQR